MHRPPAGRATVTRVRRSRASGSGRSIRRPRGRPARPVARVGPTGSLAADLRGRNDARPSQAQGPAAREASFHLIGGGLFSGPNGVSRTREEGLHSSLRSRYRLFKNQPTAMIMRSGGCVAQRADPPVPSHGAEAAAATDALPEEHGLIGRRRRRSPSLPQVTAGLPPGLVRIPEQRSSSDRIASRPR